MYICDEKGLTLRLCQHNRHQHREDVSHIHAISTEEIHNVPP